MSYRRHNKVVKFREKDIIPEPGFLATRKVYVSGGYNGYASWLKDLGFKVVNAIKGADLVLLAGGEDIAAVIYGAKEPMNYAFFTGKSSRDKKEIDDYNYAQSNKIPVWGTCRGLQMICALNGGSLIQDTDHSGAHEIHTYDGDTILVNSLHHQMCNPFTLDPSLYRILGWCPKNTSSIYTMYGNRSFEVPEDFIEPEIIYFPETQAMGVQYHPEMMSYSTQNNYQVGLKWLKKLFMKFYNGTLDDELKNYSFDRSKVEEHAIAVEKKPIIIPVENKQIALPLVSEYIPTHNIHLDI